MSFFFFNDTATTEIYTLSLHDALPISKTKKGVLGKEVKFGVADSTAKPNVAVQAQQRFISENKAILMTRSEEHTSELQSQFHLVCRLLLEKKKKKTSRQRIRTNRETKR